MKINPTKIYFPSEDYDSIFQGVEEILSSGMLTLGKNTKEFESKLSKLLHDRDVVAVNSGTGALEMSGLVLELKGSEVIVPSNTFIATALSFHRVGCHLRFGDCDKVYGSLTLNEVKRLHNEKTKAVVVVHIGGIIAPDIFKIRDYCKEHNLYLIEDAAHALGSSYKGIQAGTFGDMGTFSFFATKVITSAEGGVIVMSNPNLVKDLNIYRDQGKKDSSTNLHVRFGSNWRLSEIHALLGLYQFNRLDEFISLRGGVAKRYYEELNNDDFNVLLPPKDSITNWYKVIVNVSENIDIPLLKTKLGEKEIRLGGEVYQTPCHKQPVFKTHSNDNLPNTDQFCNNHICLPISANMTDNEVEHVIDSIKKEIKILV